uniref:ORF127 n=1 Tax=Cnaphalocrocis medinalis granulovirus TaxID=1750712 RepID=A0A0X9I078_9BBAC|nr:ORF127 [Cnaphalocrocis medinalis granulovirus]
MAESDSDSSTSQYNIGKTGTKRRRSSLTKIVSVFKKIKIRKISVPPLLILI